MNYKKRNITKKNKKRNLTKKNKKGGWQIKKLDNKSKKTRINQPDVYIKKNLSKKTSAKKVVIKK